MKFSIQREAFLTPLTQVIGVVERRQTLPVLANFLIEAEQDSLQVTGTDMEVEMVARAEVDVAQTGAITVTARKLLDICRALPEGAHINVQLSGDKLTLNAGRSRFNLVTLPAAEFPTSDQVEADAEYEIPEGQLGWLLDKTAFAMAHQDVRHYLNGLLLEFREGVLRAVATDGHRLALAEIRAPISGEVRGMILPRKGVMELNRLLEDRDASVQLGFGKNYLRVDRARTVLTSKLIDGRFPDYEAVIPLGQEKGLTLDRNEFIHALQRAAILSNEKYRGVRLEIGRKNARIVAHNPQQEEAVEELEAESSYDSLAVGFNVNYLLDALNSLDGDAVRLSMKDANSSCLVSDSASDAVRQVVMPLKL